MNEIEKLLKKAHEVDRRRLLEIMEALHRGNMQGMNIKKLSGSQRYRVRVGQFRIQLSIDSDSKAITIDSIRRRNEGTYN